MGSSVGSIGWPEGSESVGRVRRVLRRQRAVPANARKQVRLDWEQVRLDWEQVRLDWEQVRLDWEQVRLDWEQVRLDWEQVRLDWEKVRLDWEQVRLDWEQVRIDLEQARLDWEQAGLPDIFAVHFKRLTEFSKSDRVELTLGALAIGLCQGHWAGSRRSAG